MWGKIGKCFFLVVCIALAFLAGIIKRDWPIFKLKYEIDIVALFIGILTLGLTLLIAYWVSSVLEKDRDTNRNERELTLSRIADLLKTIDGLLSAVPVGVIPNAIVISSIKRSFTQNASVLELVTKAKTITTDSSFQNSIHLDLQELKILMTSYPATPPLPAGQDEPVIFNNDSFNYTVDRQSEIEQKLNDIKGHITSYTLFVIQS